MTTTPASPALTEDDQAMRDPHKDISGLFQTLIACSVLWAKHDDEHGIASAAMNDGALKLADFASTIVALRAERDGLQVIIMADDAKTIAEYEWERANKLAVENAKLRSDLAAAMIQISDLAQAKGEAEGRLRASERAGAVEGWRDRALKAEAEHDGSMATLRYCERQWADERAAMLDKAASLKGENDGLKRIATAAEDSLREREAEIERLKLDRRRVDNRIRAQRAALRQFEARVSNVIASPARLWLWDFARKKAADCRALRAALAQPATPASHDEATR